MVFFTSGNYWQAEKALHHICPAKLGRYKPLPARPVGGNRKGETAKKENRKGNGPVWSIIIHDRDRINNQVLHLISIVNYIVKRKKNQLEHVACFANNRFANVMCHQVVYME